jgi:hypothetical protein
LALHPMDTKAARNPTTDTFQAKHYCSSLFAHLKTTFSVSTIYREQERQGQERGGVDGSTLRGDWSAEDGREMAQKKL